MSNILTRASSEWSSRPADERYTSLLDMQDFMTNLRRVSRDTVVSSKRLEVVPEGKQLMVYGPNGAGYEPTHWSFGQLATLVQAPAGYLRNLPAAMAADCLNYGLKFTRDAQDVGVLIRKNGHNEFSAATGPRYGRVWNSDIVDHLVNKFGDGVSGDWRVPGEFGKRVTVTADNTTLYASDRDMFVFLADEDRRITIPNRRGGQSGTLARGFYIWNSEVGAATFGVASFLFDYVCCNRIIWGVQEYKELKFRHTAAAPDKFIDQILPVLKLYANSSPMGIVDTVKAAQAKKLDDVDAWLSKRYSVREAAQYQAVHKAEENGRPIETLWDVVTSMTAVARERQYQDSRVDLEREAGKLLDLVAA